MNGNGWRPPAAVQPVGCDGDDRLVAAAFATLLGVLGVPEDEHSERTPERAAAAWAHMLRGHHLDPRRHLRATFPAEPSAPLVIQTGVRVHSVCAHHLLPVVGLATVAYAPTPAGPIVGLSKLTRVVTEYAARATVQERVGADVAEALAGELDTCGTACIITAEHGCMTLRGVAQPGTRTTTVSLAAGWRADTAAVTHVVAEHRAAVAHGW